MHILRAAQHRRMRWKNGLGETIEVAISPEGASLDQFDWRVSMALVTADGPFSSFPSIDRTLCVLDGEGIVLTVAGRPEVTLTSTSEPYALPGDAETGSRLVGGGITDLNVMTRRSRFSHGVRRLAIKGISKFRSEADLTFLLSRSDNLMIADGPRQERLDTDDTAIFDRPTELIFSSTVVATIFVVEFDGISDRTPGPKSPP